MKNSRLFKNSSFSVLQTIVIAVAALLLFKLIVLHTGLKVTGIWSYLSSITAITGFGCYNFANALIFYVPRYKLKHDNKQLSNLINTSFFSVLGFTTILCILSYGIFSFVIPKTVEKEYIGQAQQLLPFVVLSFFFSGLSTVYLSVLDGLLLIHLRAKINMAGALIFLGSGYLLISKMGIIGVPLAQLLQNFFLLVMPYLLIKKHLPFYKFSFRFNVPVFKDIFRYGFNFQVISIAQIIGDPFMKSMITKYAGSNNTALFDFCNKLLGVARNLLISANQAIVPQITIFKTIGKFNRVRVFYKANFKIILFAGIILFLSPLALSDAISIFCLNHVSPDFNFILYNVCIGLLVNALAFPAHFHYLGTGNLKWNVINNIVTALLILVFAPLVGEFFGGRYVILCWSVSAIAGSLILITAFHKENGFALKPLFTRDTGFLFVAIFCAILVNQFLNQLPFIKSSNLIIIVADLLVLILFLLYPFFSNQITKKIINKIGQHRNIELSSSTAA